jgi:uncharacterized protein YgiM (DUF1202 family)
MKNTARILLPVAFASALALTGSGAALAAAPTDVGTSVMLAAATPTNTTKLVPPIKHGTYTISSYYGPRCMPVQDASDWHLGQDLGARDGTPIRAVASGVVRTAGPITGMGQWIIIDHVIDGQKISTVYGHMWNARKYVYAGEKVKAGQHIADVGANGVATGPHLHLEVWLGGYGVKSTNPLTWLKGKKVNLVSGATYVLPHVVPKSCTYYSTTRLNLRAGASTGTPSKVVLPVNAKLTAKPGTKTGAGWLPVTYGSKKGWVYSPYVSPTKSKVAPTTTTKKPAPKKSAKKPAAKKPVRYVDVTTLNLRSKATTKSAVVKKLHRGTAVTFAGAVSKSDWVKVTAAGKKGYVDAEYLAKTKAAALYSLKYVNVTALNLRSKPTTSSHVVALLHKNKAVQPLAKVSKGWQKIKESGKSGYVASRYLRSKK